MSTFDLVDHLAAASHGFDLSAALRTMPTVPDEPLRTHRSYESYEEDALAQRAARLPRPSAREVIEVVADEDLDGHVAQVPLGKPPKITGTQLSAVLAYGQGAAVLLTDDNSTVVVEDFDVDDPDTVPVALWSLVKTKCDPDEDEDGNKPPAVRPAALAQTITLSLRKGHARCALNPAA